MRPSLVGALVLVLVSWVAGCKSDDDADDAGTPPPPPPADMFVPERDMRPPDEDMGTPDEDMGTPDEDMGAPDEDMGTPDRDAGPPVDAGPLPTLEFAVASGDTGSAAEISVTVPITDQRSFMVVAENNDSNARMAALDITGPDGRTLARWEDWIPGANNLTWAWFAERTTAAINWPIRDVDPPLVPGDYVVRFGSYRVDGITSRPDVPVEVTTITNRDDDLTTGRVQVGIVWARGLDADAALVSATEAAVAHWAEVWAGAGMDLDVRYVTSTIDPSLPYPAPMTSDLFEEASSLVEPGEVPVIIGEIIGDEISQYGVAGRIPGPMVSSAISSIVVGWLANAGGDGVFSEDDIRLYGEVLAHEVGHYVGLFHPFEQTYDSWDALDDTPECANARMCADALSTNLMFPYSICDMGVCISTTVLTDDQRGVMQRYTGAQ